MTEVFYFQCMKRNLLLSFIGVLITFTVMRWQGRSLVTPVAPRGIVDMEFARTAERFFELRLFWNPGSVSTNIYLDFLFIAAYAWFLVTACIFIRERTAWTKWSNAFITISLAAAVFDLCENFLILLVLNGRFDTSILQIVFYCALLKFLLSGAAALFVLAGLPFAFVKGKPSRR